MKKGDYLHSSAEELEATRLNLFNEAYGPNTRRILQPYLKPNTSILELGVGTGETAKWLGEQIGTEGTYIGIDKDTNQIERAKKNVSHLSHSKLIQANVLHLDKSEALTEAKPNNGFDLIYCRWLLCHILNTDRTNVIKSIISLLAINGSFICEEPDYREMHLLHQGEPTENEAINEWKHELIPALQENLGLNLELNPSNLQGYFDEATRESPEKYQSDILECSQPELKGAQKFGLPLGILTAKHSILFCTRKTEEQLTLLTNKLEDIAEDPDKTIGYYTNTFAKITRIA